MIVVGVCACGPVVGIGGESTTSGEAGTTGGVVMSTTSSTSEQTTVSDEVTTAQPDPVTTVATDDSETTSSDPTADFILDPDGGGPTIECDIWEQDCPRGEKCMPWANDGGNSWNATKCTPLADDPREVGEPCTVEGSGVSGIDDCVIASMCWDVDPRTNIGECVAFCMGSEANPTCADPCTECAISASGPLILCLPMCDPIAQDCVEGQACYPTSESFWCAPDASGEAGAIGSPCEYINVCDPGTFCMPPGQVPGCESGVGCCAPVCNVDAADECDALLPGTTCMPWYEDGQQPEACLGMGTVGTCIAAE